MVNFRPVATAITIALGVAAPAAASSQPTKQTSHRLQHEGHLRTAQGRIDWSTHNGRVTGTVIPAQTTQPSTPTSQDPAAKPAGAASKPERNNNNVTSGSSAPGSGNSALPRPSAG